MKKRIMTALAIVALSASANAKQAKVTTVNMFCMGLYLEIYDMMIDLGATTAEAQEFAGDSYGGCISNGSSSNLYGPGY